MFPSVNFIETRNVGCKWNLTWILPHNCTQMPWPAWLPPPPHHPPAQAPLLTPKTNEGRTLFNLQVLLLEHFIVRLLACSSMYCLTLFATHVFCCHPHIHKFSVLILWKHFICQIIWGLTGYNSNIEWQNKTCCMQVISYKNCRCWLKQSLACPMIQHLPHPGRFFPSLRVSGASLLNVGWLLVASQPATHCAFVNGLAAF